VKLTAREAARLLRVSEGTLLGWIRSGGLPAHRSGERYWINDVELLEWTAARGADFHPEFASRWVTTSAPSLGEALAAGGIHYAVPGTDKETVLAEVVARLPLSAGQDPEFVLQVLLAREALGSTGVGDGIAIPHVRNPVVLPVEEPTLALCFLDHAVDFGALDHKPVDVLFTLATPTVRSHLHLLSRLSFALNDAPLRALVRARAPAEEIFAQVQRIDDALALEPLESQGDG